MRVYGTMYAVKGVPWAVLTRIRKLKPLDCFLLEDDSKAVLKQNLFCEKGVGSVSILFLEPKAKVRRHRHTQDCEFYISWNSKKGFLKTEFCRKGEEICLTSKPKKQSYRSHFLRLFSLFF